jgi:hypothetical protein
MRDNPVLGRFPRDQITIKSKIKKQQPYMQIMPGSRKPVNPLVNIEDFSFRTRKPLVFIGQKWCVLSFC